MRSDLRRAARGGADRIEWEAVLRSCTGEPTWVVCDQGKAMMAAVKRAWPNATIYICEAHLRMLGEQRLAADGFDRFDPLWRSLRKAIPNQEAWITFEQEVRDPDARMDPRHAAAQGAAVGNPRGRSATLDRRPRGECRLPGLLTG